MDETSIQDDLDGAYSDLYILEFYLDYVKEPAVRDIFQRRIDTLHNSLNNIERKISALQNPQR